ncbi:hypothetical protein ACFPPF_00680 [Xenophilus aerolatus]|nr:hypothetical protein [Xenophilus aerolatus]
MLRKIIVRRNPKLAAWLLALALAPCAAQACSISIQITLDFQKHSAELDRTQIIRLANWLTKVKGWYRYEDADVEGVASTDAPGSKALARRRAQITARALHSLYDGLEIRSSANSYPPSMQSKRDYAVIQLYPIDPPACGSAPVPGTPP